MTQGVSATRQATAEHYRRRWQELGSYAAVARELDMAESTVRRAVQRLERRERQGAEAEPAVKNGMDTLGFTGQPHSGWVKSQEPDENGNLYSYYFKGDGDEEPVDLIEQMAEVFKSIPAVELPPRSAVVSDSGAAGRLGFIPLNDLHGGMYAWGDETGYGDWDLNLAVERLQSWAGELLDRMPVCEECILFFNGDTLHRNGNDPFTPASKNVLDGDSRQYKVVDMVAAAIIAVTDMAAQKHIRVQLVIKPGNHDPDSYLALVQAAKWRYMGTTVEVDQDPCPYWFYLWGNLLLLGHHGDKRKPDKVLTKLVSDHRDLYGVARHCTLWIAHLHDYMAMTHELGRIERASCLTEPDSYGADWGDSAQAQAIIYDKERGERERITVRP